MTQIPFSDLPLSAELQRAINELDFDNPTEIQAKAIPQILEGKDIIGRSQTGTGKTAAFSIPAVEMTDGHNKRDVQVLIVCPTRELAIQSYGVIKQLYKYKSGVKAVAIYGGQQIERQIRELRKGVNIVIGTPGRIMDHMRRKTMKFDNLKMIILDEADEMLDMGFREDIEDILSKTPEDRQTVFFSATMPPEIMSITKKFQKDPVIIEVNKSHVTLDAIKHYYCECTSDKKQQALMDLINQHEIKKSIIFCNTQKMVDKLNKYLIENKFRSVAIHGGMKQNVRTVVMANFKTCKEGFLVATDVAARGIDAKDIDAVINFDIPANTEYYIHRIGRTARAGKNGDAYTIITNRAQALMLRDIERACKVKMDNDDIYKTGESVFLKDIPYGTRAKKTSFRDRNKSRQPRNNADFARVEINIGKKNFVAPNHIVRAIAEKTTLSGTDIGKIAILDNKSVVEVPKAQISEVLNALKDSKINRIEITADEFQGSEMPRQQRSFSRDKGFNRNRNNSNQGYGKNKAHSNDFSKPHSSKFNGDQKESSAPQSFGDKNFKSGKRDFKKPHYNSKSQGHSQKRQTF